ncbi:MAG: hypothetical protein ABIP35_02990 [Ginsengibacter sp.]
MEKIQILGIGRDPVVLQKLLRFINENPGWEGTGTIDDRSAVEIFGQRKYDIIVFVDSLTTESENSLRSVFSENRPDIIFIKHYGDSTGLLVHEIQEALNTNSV